MKIASLPIAATCAAFNLLMSFSARAQETCSNTTLKGSYIFSTDGILEPSQPGIRRIHAGILTFDGTGKFSGQQSSSRGGEAAREKLEGSYEIASDCSGTLTQGSILHPGTQTHWDLYVSHDGQRGEMTRMDKGSMATRSFGK